MHIKQRLFPNWQRRVPLLVYFFQCHGPSLIFHLVLPARSEVTNHFSFFLAFWGGLLAL